MARIAAIIDTNIFLNVKNREKPFFEHSLKVLAAAEAGVINAFVSAITIAELSSGYYEHNDESGLRELIRSMTANPGYDVVDVNIEVAELAGKVRSETHLPLPDSLIVACGMTSKAQYLVSHDNSFEKANNVIRPVSARTLCSIIDRSGSS